MSHRSLTTLAGPTGQVGVVGLWGAASWVKSLQSGYISNASETPTTVTISPVVPENSLLIHQGFNQSGNSQQVYWCCYITLTDATTITLTRGASGGSTAGIAWTVMELLPGLIKSVQQGVLAVPGATATATVNQVDPAKSMVFNNGFRSPGGSTGNAGEWGVRLSVVTTGVGVRADAITGPVSEVAWRLVEFY